MVYCTKCGAKNEEGVEYCVKCGANLGENSLEGVRKKNVSVSLTAEQS
jgi:uncharacterized membrane protein YvbJ